jgi:hypothetical protein
MNKNKPKDLVASLNYWQEAATNPYGTLTAHDIRRILEEIIPSIEVQLADYQ